MYSQSNIKDVMNNAHAVHVVLIEPCPRCLGEGTFRIQYLDDEKAPTGEYRDVRCDECCGSGELQNYIPIKEFFDELIRQTRQEAA